MNEGCPLPPAPLRNCLFFIQAIALQYTSATKTGWIIAVSPLALAVLSFLFLHERLGRREMGGIVLATSGVLLLVSNGSFNNFGWVKSIGDWIVLLSAFTWAIYTIASRDLSRNHNPLAVTLVMFLPLTALALLAAILVDHPTTIASFPVSVVGALIFLAVPGMLAQWVWQEGIAKLGAAKAGIFLYLEPVATTMLAIPLLGERLTVFTMIGGAMVLGRVWLAERKRTDVRETVAAVPE